MRIIAVTQRVEIISGYNETRDCLDIQWTNFLKEIGFICLPLPNDIEITRELFKKINIEGILLSGGNNIALGEETKGVAIQRDELEFELLKISKKNNIPTIGICRGMQMLNFFCNGTHSKMDNHSAERHNLTFESKYDDIFPHDVNSFHDYGITSDSLSDDFIAMAKTTDGCIESIKHKALPWFGIMWHPERELPFVDSDLKLIKNLLEQI